MTLGASGCLLIRAAPTLRATQMLPQAFDVSVAA